MKNSEQPAFPLMVNEQGMKYDIGGLTKREYFAAMAMQGFLSSWPDHAKNITPDGIASYAIACADELLKQLES